jgi:hypothetical protein
MSGQPRNPAAIDCGVALFPPRTAGRDSVEHCHLPLIGLLFCGFFLRDFFSVEKPVAGV